MKLKIIYTSAKNKCKRQYNKTLNRPIEIDSQAIKWMNYNRRDKKLTVAFHGKAKNRVYTYSDVDPQLIKSFEAAPSKGKFFSKMIRNDHPATQKRI